VLIQFPLESAMLYKFKALPELEKIIELPTKYPGLPE
jgi:hypothetical protein